MSWTQPPDSGSNPVSSSGARQCGVKELTMVSAGCDYKMTMLPGLKLQPIDKLPPVAIASVLKEELYVIGDDWVMPSAVQEPSTEHRVDDPSIVSPEVSPGRQDPAKHAHTSAVQQLKESRPLPRGVKELFWKDNRKQVVQETNARSPAGRSAGPHDGLTGRERHSSREERVASAGVSERWDLEPERDHPGVKSTLLPRISGMASTSGAHCPPVRSPEVHLHSLPSVQQLLPAGPRPDLEPLRLHDDLPEQIPWRQRSALRSPEVSSLSYSAGQQVRSKLSAVRDGHPPDGRSAPRQNDFLELPPWRQIYSFAPRREDNYDSSTWNTHPGNSAGLRRDIVKAITIEGDAATLRTSYGLELKSDESPNVKAGAATRWTSAVDQLTGGVLSESPLSRAPSESDENTGAPDKNGLGDRPELSAEEVLDFGNWGGGAASPGDVPDLIAENFGASGRGTEAQDQHEKIGVQGSLTEQHQTEQQDNGGDIGAEPQGDPSEEPSVAQAGAQGPEEPEQVHQEQEQEEKVDGIPQNATLDVVAAIASATATAEAVDHPDEPRRSERPKQTVKKFEQEALKTKPQKPKPSGSKRGGRTPAKKKVCIVVILVWLLWT